jgi:hypothetical protein
MSPGEPPWTEPSAVRTLRDMANTIAAVELASFRKLLRFIIAACNACAYFPRFLLAAAAAPFLPNSVRTLRRQVRNRTFVSSSSYGLLDILTRRRALF